jgi:aminoglycoside phosphotransferase family enzyme/predicted kinase
MAALGQFGYPSGGPPIIANPSCPMTELSPETQRPLIDALRDPACYPHPCEGTELVETHISAVILTGPYAYKIKKPLDFGFLDFTTLARRKHFCEEEIRLNRRLAPSIYLDVVPIGGTPQAPVIGAEQAPIEYAVRMRQFDQSLLLDRLVERAALPIERMDEIAERVARFHQQAAVADPASDFGTPDAVFYPVQQNFDQLRPLITEPEQVAQLERLERWSRERFESLREIFERRKRGERIRECHGDMHLGNMALVDDEVAIFDGIEFNDYFRWIDVMSEIAFLVMDLDDRGLPAYANRVLNLYLEHTGDYEGLAVLDFYKVYRAMVRAKISALRLTQDLDETERRRTLAQYAGYTDLAERYTERPAPRLMITHGVSGSGKTTIAGMAVERYGAIRLRSDVERKRMHALEAAARTDAGLDEGIYSEESTRATYQRLADLAEQILQAGFTVIADATFLKRWQRELFEQLAERLGIDLVILDIEVPLATLARWIAERQATGQDASEADLSVVEHQLKSQDNLSGNERSLTRVIHAESPDLALALDSTLAPTGLARGSRAPRHAGA